MDARKKASPFWDGVARGFFAPYRIVVMPRTRIPMPADDIIELAWRDVGEDLHLAIDIEKKKIDEPAQQKLRGRDQKRIPA